MDTLYLALGGFVFWTILVGFCLTSYRSIFVLTGKKKSNEFPAGIQHGSEFNWRFNRAHMNCLENVPLFVAVAFLSVSLQKVDSFVNQAALTILVARVLQTITHLISGSPWFVNIRFTFYSIQIFSYAAILLHIFSIL